MEERIQRLAALLHETSQKHDEAFIKSDGYNPDWAIWYADYLVDRLPEHLGVRLARAEIVYLLMRLSYLQQMEAPGALRPHYVARKLLERYGPL